MKQKKGIALITVLMVSVVMMILLGSFVRLNLQNFGFMNNDQHQVASAEAARSAFDYCLYRLERNRNWGASAFEGGKDASVSKSLEVEKVEGTHTIKGKVLESGAEFEVVVLNNINGASEVDNLEEGMIRLRITANRGSGRVTREAVLKTAPLFDGSVVASELIDIDAENLIVSSTDPMRNRLRSKGSIKVPNYTGNHLKFQPADNATERGVLWAKNGIESGSKDLSDPDVNLDAAKKTQGQFLPNANTHHEIYDLQLSEIATNETNIPLKSGIYVFNRRTIESAAGPSYNVPVLERRDWAVNSEGEVEGGDIREVWFPKGSLPEGAKGMDYFGIGGVSAEDGVHAVGSGEFSIGGTDGRVKVNFNSLDEKYEENGGEFKPPSLVLDSTVNFEVNGDFGVTSFDSEYHPTIKFQDPRTGIVDGGDVEKGGIVNSVVDVESSGVSNASGSGRTSGSITTHSTKEGKPGSIYIGGAISGSGKLLADGNVTVRNTFANVSTDDESDLSIFAGGNVTLRPQKARSIDANSIFAGTSEKTQGTTRFRGLVFAGEDVLIEADKNLGDAVEKSDIFIEGAVVARKGSVQVQSADKVNFKYNPELLDTILNPKKDSRVRLERVVWKEF
jgi:hypothetical protein